MTTDDDAAADPLLIDVAVAHIMARATDDSAILLAAEFVRHAHEVAVSPELGSWITGRSAAAIRSAVDRGQLPSAGHGVKRFVLLRDLAAWNGMPLSPTAIQLALERAAWRRPPPSWLRWMGRAGVPGSRRGAHGFGDAVDALRTACTEPEELAQ